VEAASKNPISLHLVFDLRNVDGEIVPEPNRLGEQSLSDAPKLFRLGVRRLDLFVQNQIARHVPEHGSAMAGVTTELSACLLMPHDDLPATEVQIRY
jgi:hypothetical protein